MILFCPSTKVQLHITHVRERISSRKYASDSAEQDQYTHKHLHRLVLCSSVELLDEYRGGERESRWNFLWLA